MGGVGFAWEGRRAAGSEGPCGGKDISGEEMGAGERSLGGPREDHKGRLGKKDVEGEVALNDVGKGQGEGNGKSLPQSRMQSSIYIYIFIIYYCACPCLIDDRRACIYICIYICICMYVCWHCCTLSRI